MLQPHFQDIPTTVFDACGIYIYKHREP